MKNKKIKKFLIIICLCWFALKGGIVLAEEVSEYIENYEKIPGQERTANFVEYLEGLYKFGIAIVAILAIFMISFGAFVYVVTSAGNASKMMDAKNMIFSAIFGLILALTAYLVLYLINPDLVKGTVKQFSKVSLTSKKVNGLVVNKSIKYESYNTACPESKQSDEKKSKEPIDFKKAETKEINSACNQYDEWFKEYGGKISESDYVGECILKAIAHKESYECTRPNAVSNDGCCGLMQLDPNTAGVSCEELKKNPKLSIEKAAEYIKKNISGKCVTGAKNKLSAIFAGYNGGYGCTENVACPNPKTGKSGPLCQSKDCSSGLAFECCINPGDLKEAIAYAWDGVGLYKTCVAKKEVK